MAVDLEMAELGVRQQDAIVDDSRPDASAQGGEDDDARDTLGCTVVDLTQASGVCVVEDGHGAAEGITDVVLGMQAGPPLVEVGDEGDDAVACRGGEGDANRSVANGGAKLSTISRSTATTFFGDDFPGVGMRSRGSAKSPMSRSTGAPLIPEPPTSIPSTLFMVDKRSGCQWEEWWRRGQMAIDRERYWRWSPF